MQIPPGGRELAGFCVAGFAKRHEIGLGMNNVYKHEPLERILALYYIYIIFFFSIYTYVESIRNGLKKVVLPVQTQ